MSKARSLRDVLQSGDMCPYCRSEDVTDRTESDLDAENYDYLCRDCGFLWKADGVDVTPPTKPAPDQL
jgi:predicted Zn-ribbon and HTH transcriptional regulator